jgi:molybdopterin-guanine dinucleotide biosynthesis protein A
MGLQSISGAILAGGRSSRFGRDKALEVWRGKTLLEHVASSLKACAERFVVGGTLEQYGFLGLPVHPDSEAHRGSLYGLARALELARMNRVATTACDMPNLTPLFWHFLSSLAPTDVVIPEGPDGDLEPLAAIYARTCLEPVRHALEANQLKMTGWFGDLGVRVVPWAQLESRFGKDVFLNINRLSDLTTDG